MITMFSQAKTIKYFFRLFLLIMTMFSVYSEAESPSELKLAFPVACKLNQNCWIVNYFDHDPGEKIQDFGCGQRTYNNHDGTDIGIGSVANMQKGVMVFAAAAGTVKAIRNDMQDISFREGGWESIQEKTCGNGVLIDHGRGLETQYCHMKKASILVKAGDIVKEGQQLGQVGLSGASEFPHLHLNVVRNGKRIDPFTNTGIGTDCSIKKGSLWKDNIPYKPMHIANISISDVKPMKWTILTGIPENTQITEKNHFFSVNFEIYGIEPYDLFEITLVAPSGKVMSNQEYQLQNHSVWKPFRLTVKQPSGGWPKGTYQVRTKLFRHSNKTLDEKNLNFEIFNLKNQSRPR